MVIALRRRAALFPLAVLLCAITAAGVILDRAAAGRVPASRMALYWTTKHPAGDIGGPGYPRHAVGADGARVEVAALARRIVSQEWSIDEYLYTLLPPDRVVGVSQAAYDSAFSNVADLASRFHPPIAADVEAVIRMKPDLVVVSSTARADFTELLRAAGVPVYRAHTTPATLAEIEVEIGVIGYLAGVDAAAAQARAAFRGAIDAAAPHEGNASFRPRVLGLSGHYVYGSGTVFDDVLSVLGADNVAAASGVRGYVPLTSEEIVRANPEWIVTGAPAGLAAETRAQLQADPAIASTVAARSGQIVVLEQREFIALSPFTARVLAALRAELYAPRDRVPRPRPHA
jgi:iron complex transport system substrate-binding protein